MWEVRTLESLSFEEIISCFLKSFEGYFVKMPEDPAYYHDRWLAAGVRFDFSFGAFNNERLVGFILHCIDHRDGHNIAFNTGTGVIPEFRGNRIISTIYQEALPVLISNGVTKSRLEVIQQNFTALNIYRKTGFEITRDYKCFQGEIKANASPARLQEITVSDMPWNQIPNQQLQSWDHQRNSLINGPYTFYQALLDGKPIGVVVLNLDFRYLALFETTSGDPKHWDNLLAGVATLSPEVKINNVDRTLIRKVRSLESVGLQNTVDQYEMELSIIL